MARTTPVKAAEVFTIDPTGDVILNVAGTHHLRISSKILALASRPFAAMFGPNFSEGRALSATNLPSISLPEDDGEAMLWICRTLYHEQCKPWDYWSGLLAIRVTTVVEKYDMVQALGYRISGEISRILVIHGSSKFGCLVWCLFIASYILGDAAAFRKASFCAILDTDLVPRAFSVAVRDVSTRIPDAVFCMIDAERLKLRAGLHEEMLRVAMMHLMPYCEAFEFEYFDSWDDMRYDVLLERADHGEKVSEILRAFGSGSCKKALGSKCKELLNNLKPLCLSKMKELHEAKPDKDLEEERADYFFASELVTCVEKRLREVKGLCLSCAKEEKISAAECKGCGGKGKGKK